MPLPRIAGPLQTAAVVRAGWACVLLLVPEKVLRIGGGPPVPAAAAMWFGSALRTSGWRASFALTDSSVPRRTLTTRVASGRTASTTDASTDLSTVRCSAGASRGWS